jgi:tetratricopeptide (TPR) repeat protein
LAGAAAVALLLGAAGAGVYRWASAPAPPAIDLAGADPEVAQAVEEACDRVREAPRSADAWGRLGMVLLAHEIRTAAASCFARAEDFDPGEPRWPYLHALALLQDNPDPDAGLGPLERAAERCGTVAVPRLRLGEVLLRLGRLDEAERQFRAVLEAMPNNPRAELGLGRVAAARGDLEGSLDHLRRSAEALPGVRATHLLLAEVHHQRGDGPAEEEELALLANLPDDFPWPDPYLEQVQQLRVGVRPRAQWADALLKEGRGPEAVKVMREAVRTHPDSPVASLGLGRTLAAVGDYDGAEHALRRAVELRPEDAQAQYDLGVVLHRRGSGQAAASFRKATELLPTLALAHFGLGLCLQEEGDRAGAIRSFRAAVRYKPDYAAAHKLLGLALAQEGQDAEALAHLQQAVQLDPADEEAKQGLERLRRGSAAP